MIRETLYHGDGDVGGDRCFQASWLRCRPFLVMPDSRKTRPHGILSGRLDHSSHPGEQLPALAVQ